MSEGPYSRVYWSVLDDKKFDEIRADMRHFGSWTMMLVVAEMAYPAPAFIPPTVPRTSLQALAKAGLIDLLPARMYRVKGLKKEREARSARGKVGADARWLGIADAMRPHSDGNATGLLAKQSKAETSKGLDENEQRARLGPSDDETMVLAFLANHGAFIRPESGFGQRVIGLIARRGLTAVIEEAERMAQAGNLSDRQWVFGLEERLEDIPQAPRVDARTAAVDEAAAKRSNRVFDQMHARRIEWFKNTGEWNPDYGPEPKWNPVWGERPTVTA